jgi:hypothetical protein
MGRGHSALKRCATGADIRWRAAPSLNSPGQPPGSLRRKISVRKRPG